MTLDALRALESDFWRAPSAHNTQPWTLRYRGARVEVGWDPSRTRPAGDPTGRDLRLSLGAFVETCLIVCADAGLDVRFVPDYDEPARRAGHLVAAGVQYTTPFTAQDVRGRRCARAPYRPGRLDAAVLRRLEHLAAEEKAEVRRLRCRELIGLLHEADRHVYSTPSMAFELREWLRLDPSDPRYGEDGLTDRTLGLSRRDARRLRTFLSPRGYPLLRRLGAAGRLARSSLGALDYEGEAVVLVGRPGCSESEQVELGRVLMRQWLTLAALGYTTHPLSQILDTEVSKQRLARLLDLDDPSRLMNVARVGRPVTTPPESARLPR